MGKNSGKISGGTLKSPKPFKPLWRGAKAVFLMFILGGGYDIIYIIWRNIRCLRMLRRMIS